MSDTRRFREAVEKFDEANTQDPNRESDGGKEYPKELLYAQRMTAMLDRFAPEASEALRLAARAQHIRRWVIPRAQFPNDRAGYHKWRKTLYEFHADEAGQILRELKFDEPLIGRVQSLIRKQKLKTDAEAQTLEDVICLVFLEHYLDDFAGKHPEEKIIDILQKTWKKMSDRAHETALALNFSPDMERLVKKALALPESGPG